MPLNQISHRNVAECCVFMPLNYNLREKAVGTFADVRGLRCAAAEYIVRRILEAYHSNVALRIPHATVSSLADPPPPRKGGTARTCRGRWKAKWCSARTRLEIRVMSNLMHDEFKVGQTWVEKAVGAGGFASVPVTDP